MSPFVQRALSGEEIVAIVAAVERCSAGDAADQAWMLAAPRLGVQAPSCAPRPGGRARADVARRRLEMLVRNQLPESD